MSKAEDINTLFRRFGGNADTYQEIVEGELAGVAEQKWPMLGQLRPQAHREAPAARKGAVASGDRQVHAFMDPPRHAVVPPAEPAAVTPVVVSPAPVVAAQPPVGEPAVAPTSLQTPVSVSVPVVTPLGALGLPSRVEPPAEPLASTVVVRPPLPTLFGRAAVAPAVRAEAVPPLRQPVAPISVSVPVALQQAAVAVPLVTQVVPPVPAVSEPGESDLQALFNRLVPPKVEPPAASPVAPLKRLAKW